MPQMILVLIILALVMLALVMLALVVLALVMPALMILASLVLVLMAGPRPILSRLYDWPALTLSYHAKVRDCCCATSPKATMRRWPVLFR
jgi:hypothetical protein